ncbi:MAG: hypothetical protein RL722_566 [Pseudomonadota bacterium]
MAAWLLGRLAGYAAGGMAAASLGQVLLWLSETQAWARPAWLMVQLAMFVLGLVLMLRGRLPLALEQQLAAWGRQPVARNAGGGQVVLVNRRWQGGLRTALVGGLWVAMPCGVLQAALVVAALASSPLEGGLAMALFALCSAPGVLAGQWLWRWLGQRRLAALVLGPDSGDGRAAPTASSGYGADLAATRWSLRLAGLGISLLSGGTVAMGIWAPLVAWCS